LAGCANIQGLRFAQASSFTTPSPAGTYTTAILVTEVDTIRWHTLRLSSDGAAEAPFLSAYSESGAALPPKMWTSLYPELGSTIRTSPDGLLLHTGHKAHTDSAAFGPIVIPASGRYRFSLAVIPRSGEFVFGVVAGAETNWVAAVASEESRPGTKLECWSDLRQGQRVWLRISNRSSKDAEFVIREVRAYQLEPTR
jgi:hypothetical protein